MEKFNPNIMNKEDLNKLSKSKIIKLVLNLYKKLEENRDNYKPRRQIPTPRKSVKQFVKEYEENIIPPPPKFRDNYKPRRPIPTPRKSVKQFC